MVNLENLKFLKRLLSGIKIICLFVKVDQNVYKTANKSASLQTNQMLLSILAISLSYLHDLSHTFLKRLKLLWGKALGFLQITAEHQNCPVLNHISNHKNSIRKYLDNNRFRLNFSNIEAAIEGKSWQHYM